MGYDSFGLPAEQYAVKTGNNPNGFTQKNIETFTKQLKELGFDYDWSKTLATSDLSSTSGHSGYSSSYILTDMLSI